MNKRTTYIICICLVTCFLMGTAGTASASPLNDGPVVTALTGSGNFTTRTIDFEDLPGTIKDEERGIFPINSPSGGMQFNSDGIEVSGLIGSASVCFPMKSPRYGWKGTVYQWNGSAWSKLDTTMTENSEGLNSQACAAVYSDGIYALVLGYKEPPTEKKIHECVNIQIIYPYFEEDDELNRLYITGGIVYPGVPLGSIVKYELRNIQPAGSLTGSLTATGTVIELITNPSDPTQVASIVEFPEGTYVDYADDWKSITFTVRFYTTGCYKDFKYPDDLDKLPK